MPRETRHEVPWPMSLWDSNWENKKPDPLPDLSYAFEFWDSTNPWWNRDVSDVPVDEELTNLWQNQEVQNVRGASNHRTKSWDGVPYQDITGEKDTRVHRRTVPAPWWSPSMARVPLPRSGRFVRRYGDPTNHYHGSDSQWFGIDLNRGLLHEASAIGENAIWIPSKWGLGSYRTLDLNLPPDHPFNRQAATVANAPMIPLLNRPEEYQNGRVTHAQHLTIAASHGSSPGIQRDNRYSNEPRWPATATDGIISGHPFQAGMWLRLKKDFVIPQDATIDDRIDVKAQQEHGLVVTDVTSFTAGHGIRRAMAPYEQMRHTLNFQASDYEVLAIDR